LAEVYLLSSLPFFFFILFFGYIYLIAALVPFVFGSSLIKAQPLFEAQ